MVQQYIPAVANSLQQRLTAALAQEREQLQLALFASESSPVYMKIAGVDPRGFTVAARPVATPPVTAMNPSGVPPMPAQPAQPSYAPPIPPPGVVVPASIASNSPDMLID